ncbi:MAG TPA: DUF2946 domain-containing protein [Burkholderiaceae bacterium]
MSSRRGHRIATHWIAVFAILLVTFAPSLTGLLSASRGQLWDQVCSATSPAAAKTAAGGDESPAAPHAFEHCPYCALHADLAPPPDPRQADAGVPLAFRVLPAAFVRAPRSNAVWASAQPRAPPLVA